MTRKKGKTVSGMQLCIYASAVLLLMLPAVIFAGKPNLKQLALQCISQDSKACGKVEKELMGNYYTEDFTYAISTLPDASLSKVMANSKTSPRVRAEIQKEQNKRKELELKRQEELSWQKCQDNPHHKCFETYLIDWPNGTHATNAKDELAFSSVENEGKFENYVAFFKTHDTKTFANRIKDQALRERLLTYIAIKSISDVSFSEGVQTLAEEIAKGDIESHIDQAMLQQAIYSLTIKKIDVPNEKALSAVEAIRSNQNLGTDLWIQWAPIHFKSLSDYEHQTYITRKHSEWRDIIEKANRQKAEIIYEMIDFAADQNNEVNLRGLAWVSINGILRGLDIRRLREKDGAVYNTSYAQMPDELETSYSPLKSALQRAVLAEKNPDVAKKANTYFSRFFTQTLDNAEVSRQIEPPPRNWQFACPNGIVYDKTAWRCITAEEKRNPALLEGRGTITP